MNTSNSVIRDNFIQSGTKLNSTSACYSGPVKEEEVYLNPRIVIFYDIISDKEILTVKELATSRLDHAYVIIPTGKEVLSDTRVAETAWIQNNEHEDVANIYR